MATGSKAGLYQNAQSASYLPLTLIMKIIEATFCGSDVSRIPKISIGYSGVFFS